MGTAKFLKLAGKVAIALAAIAFASGQAATLCAQSFAHLQVSATVLEIRNTDSLVSRAASEVTNDMATGYSMETMWRERLGGLALVRADRPTGPIQAIRVTFAYAAN